MHPEFFPQKSQNRCCLTGIRIKLNQSTTLTFIVIKEGSQLRIQQYPYSSCNIEITSSTICRFTLPFSCHNTFPRQKNSVWFGFSALNSEKRRQLIRRISCGQP
jgi:hypothetical protein